MDVAPIPLRALTWEPSHIDAGKVTPLALVALQALYCPVPEGTMTLRSRLEEWAQGFLC